MSCLWLIACNTAKQAQKHIDKAMKKNPETVANYTREKFPCLTTSDTLIKLDTAFEFIEIQCPETPGQIVKTDTVYLKTPGQIRTIKSEGKTVIVPQIVNKTTEVKIRVRDSADLFLLAKEKEKNADLKRKIERKNDWILWLFFMLLLSIVFFVFNLLKPKR